MKQYQDLNVKLQQENKDLEEQQNQLINEQRIFEEEREDWKRHLEQAKIEITEQNDRLALLSQQLTGTKVRNGLLAIMQLLCYHSKIWKLEVMN